jgi:hypothetical protein
MRNIQNQIASPADTEAANLIVDWLVANPKAHSEVVNASLKTWNRQGCHLLAQALKGSPHFGRGHMLAATLRQVANTAIILEHRLATRQAA